jgi:HSP20 family molecular chaperone IbpA
MSEDATQLGGVETTPNGAVEGAATATPKKRTQATSTPPSSVRKPKHDWYQTESDVCVTILLKKVKKENVQVTFLEKMVGN